MLKPVSMSFRDGAKPCNRCWMESQSWPATLPGAAALTASKTLRFGLGELACLSCVRCLLLPKLYQGVSCVPDMRHVTKACIPSSSLPPNTLAQAAQAGRMKKQCSAAHHAAASLGACCSLRLLVQCGAGLQALLSLGRSHALLTCATALAGWHA